MILSTAWKTPKTFFFTTTAQTQCCQSQDDNTAMDSLRTNEPPTDLLLRVSDEWPRTYMCEVRCTKPAMYHTMMPDGHRQVFGLHV